jgi:hypothetical protein
MKWKTLPLGPFSVRLDHTTSNLQRVLFGIFDIVAHDRNVNRNLIFCELRHHGLVQIKRFVVGATWTALDE